MSDLGIELRLLDQDYVGQVQANCRASSLRLRQREPCTSIPLRLYLCVSVCVCVCVCRFCLHLARARSLDGPLKVYVDEPVPRKPVKQTWAPRKQEQFLKACCLWLGSFQLHVGAGQQQLKSVYIERIWDPYPQATQLIIRFFDHIWLYIFVSPNQGPEEGLHRILAKGY